MVEFKNCEFHQFTPDVQVRVDTLVALAVLAEREACAELCESMANEYDCVDVRQAAAAIRKR